MAQGRRPDPFRTRKLRPGTAMVLHPEGCGRVARRRTQTSQGGDTTSVPPPFFTYPGHDRKRPPTPEQTPGHGTNGPNRDTPTGTPVREPARTKPHTRQAHTPNKLATPDNPSTQPVCKMHVTRPLRWVLAILACGPTNEHAMPTE